jgi:hypothetical protein
MGETSISWTNWTCHLEAAVRQHKTVYQAWVHDAVAFFEPGIEIGVPLGRVAGCTSWDNVSRRCFPTFGDWDHMVPCVGGFSAIGAFSIKIFCDRFHSDDRDWIDASLSAMSVLTPFGSVCWIGSVSLSCFGILVGLTTSIFPQLGADPISAVSAPD